MRSLADIILTKAVANAVAEAQTAMASAAAQAKSDKNTSVTQAYFTQLAADYEQAIAQLRGATLMEIKP